MAGCESQTVQPEMSETASDVPAEKSIVDLGALIALIGDDPEVIAETLDIFARGAKQASASIRLAVRNGSAASAGEAAHKFKSGARAIGATRLDDVCARIEELAGVGDIRSIAAAWPSYETEMEAVWRFLETQGATSPPPHQAVGSPLAHAGQPAAQEP